MRSLRELLEGLPEVQLFGEAQVCAIQVDSRKVQPGDLFVAICGTKQDGHQFVQEAIQRGASAILVSDPSAIPPSAPAYAIVSDTREALWRIAKRFYNDPSQRMLVIGITGTNGKTTTAHFLHRILMSAGYSTLMIGTLGVFLNDTPLDESIELTTPDVVQLQALLAKAVQIGARACVMEVSSHALHQRRVDGIAYDAGVFTNLSQDHLDYHGTMEAYAEAKLRLFTDLPAQSAKPFRSIINLDTEWSAWFIERCAGELWTYGTSPQVRVRAGVPSTGGAVGSGQWADEGSGQWAVGNMEGSGQWAVGHSLVTLRQGITFIVEWERGAFAVRTHLSAPYNLYNALAGVATALSLGIPIPAIQKGIESLSAVPGRFERVPLSAPYEVVIDFAHTPDALHNLLQTARQLKPKRLTVVFGCGGDRDPSKRPLMGAIAVQLADRVIITSDNPRAEDPLQIIEQIMQGIPESERERVWIQPDRRQAIWLALETAQPGELVLLAGKGHEPYQIIGTTKYPFSDRQVVLDYIGAKRA